MAANKGKVSIVLEMIDRSSSSLNKVSKSTKSLSNNMKSLGQSMMKVSLPLLAVGAAGVKMASDLDKSMRNIQAFGGQTEKQIKDLSQTFKDMSQDAKFGTQSAQQLADSYFNIQSAGFLGAEGMEVLAVSARAATAGLTTTQKASEGIMTVLNAYGLAAKDAAKVSDSLFTIVKLGVITFEQLIPTLGSVVPLANAMGIEFNELGAAYVVMTKQGLNATEAATQQKAVMTQLLAPSEALSAQMQKLGFSSGQAMVDSLGLLGSLDMLGDSVGNSATEMQNLFVNTRAVQGAIALTGANAEKAAIALEEMQKAGAAQEAFNTQMKSFSAQFALFTNTLGVFLIDIGEKLLPVLMKVMEVIRAGVKTWNSMDGSVKTVVVAVGAFFAIMGPTIAILGTMFGILSTTAGALSAVAGAFTATSIAAPTAAVAIASTGAATIPATAGFTALAASLWASLAPFAAVLAPIALVGVALAGLVAFGPKILEFGKNVVDGLIRGIKDPIGAVAWGIGKLFGTNIKAGTAEGINGTGQIVVDQVVKVAKVVNTGANKMNKDLIQVANTATRVAQHVDKFDALRVDSTQRLGENRNNARGGSRTTQYNSRGIAVARGNSRTNVTSIANNRSYRQRYGNRTYGAGRNFKGENISTPLSSVSSFGNRGVGGSSGAINTGFVSSGAGGGGDVNITIEEMIMPPGTPKEHVDLFWDEIKKRFTSELTRRGTNGRLQAR